VVQDVKATTGSDVVLYALDADGRLRVAASSLPRTPALDSALLAFVAPSRARPAHGTVLRIGGTRYYAQGATATTAGGEAVGGWTLLRVYDAGAAGLAGMRQSVAIAMVVGFLLALAAAWVAARRVTRPIRLLADAARRAAEGDYDPSRPEVIGDLDGDASDEIAALGAAFRAMLADLRDREALTALGAAMPNELAAVAAGVAATATATATAGATAAVGAARPVRGGARGVLRLDARAAGDADAPRRLADRYELQAVVGSGGSGIVYRALDHALGEVVAVKMLRPELLVADPLARERLTHEIRLARRISNRHVVRIHDFAEDDGVPFLTMEYVDGPSLGALLRARGGHPSESRGLPPRTVLAIAKQLVRALDVAHAQGVVHGDLKPGNLLVGAGGVLKVSDFGVARLVRAPVAPDAARLAGAIVGTTEYMAPELLLGRAPDVRADIYAAGVVLHECLTGETPFHADTPVAFFAHKLDETPARGTPVPARPALAQPTSLAAALTTLVNQMTAADPAERPASARALHELLLRIG
jgi:serine/threonine-protein kinase